MDAADLESVPACVISLNLFHIGEGTRRNITVVARLHGVVIRNFICSIESMQVSVASPSVGVLLSDLQQLRESCLAMEREFGASIAEACPQSRRSVQNLDTTYPYASAICAICNPGSLLSGSPRLDATSRMLWPAWRPL